MKPLSCCCFFILLGDGRVVPDMYRGQLEDNNSVIITRTREARKALGQSVLGRTGLCKQVTYQLGQLLVKVWGSNRNI